MLVCILSRKKIAKNDIQEKFVRDRSSLNHADLPRIKGHFCTMKKRKHKNDENDNKMHNEQIFKWKNDFFCHRCESIVAKKKKYIYIACCKYM